MYGESSTARSASSAGRSIGSATHVGPRDHHVGDVLVGEVEDLVDHLLLAPLDLALLGRAREQHPQLDLRVRGALGAGRLLAEQRSTSSVERFSSQISGFMTKKKPRTGVETASAIRSGWPSAIPFGTSSPSTTCRKVMISSAKTTARKVAISGSNRSAKSCSPNAPMASEVSVTPSCIAAMKFGGSAVIRSTARARRLPCAVELADPRPPRRDEAVLRRHEERVQHDQAARARSWRRESSAAPLTGAQVLGGKSSSKRPAS